MLPNLRKLRNQQNISQAALAKAIGITQQSINLFENHDVDPSLPVLLRLAEYFNTSIDYIAGRTSIQRPVEYTSPYDLNENEARLIDQYRLLSAQRKHSIDVMLHALSEE